MAFPRSHLLKVGCSPHDEERERACMHIHIRRCHLSKPTRGLFPIRAKRARVHTHTTPTIARYIRPLLPLVTSTRWSVTALTGVPHFPHRTALSSPLPYPSRRQGRGRVRRPPSLSTPLSSPTSFSPFDPHNNRRRRRRLIPMLWPWTPSSALQSSPS